MKKNSKGFAHLVLLVVLLLGVGLFGLFSYQKGFISFNNPSKSQTPSVTPNPTDSPTPVNNLISGWNVSSFSTYEIKYPSDVIAKKEEGSILILSKTGPTQTDATELFDGFSITFQPREIPDTTLSKYVSTKIEAIEKQGVGKVTSGPNPIDLNGYSGFSYTEEGLGIFNKKIIESKDKIMFMEISILVSDPGKLGFQETVDQILSTFKFTSNIRIQSDEQEVREFISEYMSALIKNDWVKFKSYLTPATQEEFDQNYVIPSVKSYEIISINGPDKNGYYTVTMKMYDGAGKSLKNPADPRILVTRLNNEWKSLTWYLFQ